MVLDQEVEVTPIQVPVKEVVILDPVQAHKVHIYHTPKPKALQIVLLENQDVMQEAYTILADIGMLPSMMKMEML